MDGRWPHWRCRDCGTFDGPISNGDCDVCFDESGNSVQVVGLVPCDDAAIQRAERAVGEVQVARDDTIAVDELVEIVFRAAGETP